MEYSWNLWQNTFAMIMRNPFTILILFALTLACQQDNGLLSTCFSLPKKLKEVSGIIYTPKSDLIWTLEDSGNENKIYSLGPKGTIEKTITINNTLNTDWEDITKDEEGNLYIGDFGNNDNTRRDLCIYKIEKKSLDKENAIPAYKVAFEYPEQKGFPPKKRALFYDVEGFFEYQNHFYLFTKNRSKGFDGTALVYKIPNKPGFHQAQLIGKFQSCDDYNHCAITSAAISPDNSKVVILSHSKVWLFEHFQGDDFLKGTKNELDLHHYSQKEAVCFKDNDTLLIADEKNGKTGGKVYEVSISKLKSKP